MLASNMCDAIDDHAAVRTIVLRGGMRSATS